MSRTGGGSILSVLARLDAWLIAGPYQGVVDLSQRTPVWLARQCVIGALVLEVLRFVLFPPESMGTHWAMMALMGVGVAGCWVVTMSPLLFAVAGAQTWIRAAFLALCIIRVVTMLFIGTPRGAYNLLADGAFMSFYYFAACKPPRPRVPRTRMAGAGGAA